MKTKRLLSVILILISLYVFSCCSAGCGTPAEQTGTASVQEASGSASPQSAPDTYDVPGEPSPSAADAGSTEIFLTEEAAQPDVPAATEESDSGPGVEDGKTPVTIRVGSYNIHNGSDVGHDFSIIANDILDAGLDIVGLQEVDICEARSGYQDTLAKLREFTGYEYSAFIPASGAGSRGYGNGILSRYPIVSYEIISIEPDGEEFRSLGHAVIDVNGIQIDFYVTHLSYKYLDVREEQAQFVADTVTTGAYILTGDFNSFSMSLYDCFEGAQMINTRDNLLLSYDGRRALDNIICSQEYRIVSFGIENGYKHSDHYLIWAEIEISL